MEEAQKANQIAREALISWQHEIQKNVYTSDSDFIHTIAFHFSNNFTEIHSELELFGQEVANKLEELVSENNKPLNLPRLEEYNSIGMRIDKIIHHPTYVEAGDIIYRTGLLQKMSKKGGLSECLSLLFLASQVGEAGHNCPIACSAGIIRVLKMVPNFPNRDKYLEKLLLPSFQTNFTGAQFLTEIQGGSDVGLNAVYAKKGENQNWRIYGEKWFCSNASANLIFVTARYAQDKLGTKGLGLFLIPAEWEGKKNLYTVRRLKDKIGTRSMATGEIDFHGAHAVAIGSLEEGFHLVMDNVLHLSRLFNAFCVLGMARRAYSIAFAYAKHRIAFSHSIIDYPLVKETLAKIKAENTAMIAGIFATAKIQDRYDTGKAVDEKTKLLLRLLVNIQKYLSAKWSVEHIHHSLDVLAGNGTIENFSPLPRLLRDCLVCENWEGTHNVLRMQILKDIFKYEVDKIFLTFMNNQAKNISSEQAKLIVAQLETFEKELVVFRSLSKELQSLQIRMIVDKMGILYCALMLLIEALDQKTSKQSTSKLDCFHYFCFEHLNKKNDYDQSYLELISRINLYESDHIHA